MQDIHKDATKGTANIGSDWDDWQEASAVQNHIPAYNIPGDEERDKDSIAVDSMHQEEQVPELEERIKHVQESLAQGTDRLCSCVSSFLLNLCTCSFEFACLFA